MIQFGILLRVSLLSNRCVWLFHSTSVSNGHKNAIISFYHFIYFSDVKYSTNKKDTQNFTYILIAHIHLNFKINFNLSKFSIMYNFKRKTKISSSDFGLDKTIHNCKTARSWTFAGNFQIMLYRRNASLLTILTENTRFEVN